MDEGEEARSKLVKAHGDTAELLEFEEEGLHKVAFLVHRRHGDGSNVLTGMPKGGMPFPQGR